MEWYNITYRPYGLNGFQGIVTTCQYNNTNLSTKLTKLKTAQHLGVFGIVLLFR